MAPRRRPAEEEEEEEGDGFLWRRLPPQPPAPPAPAPREQDTAVVEAAPDLPLELEEPGDEEDALRAVGDLAQGAWRYTAELRQRRRRVEEEPARREGAGEGVRPARAEQQLDAGLFEDEDAALRQSERAHFLAEQSTALWRQALLVPLVLAGVLAAAAERRPTEDSFRAMRDTQYGATNQRQGGEDQEAVSNLSWPLLADRSFEGRVARSSYVDHWSFALATVALSVAVEPGGGNSTKAGSKATPVKKVYEHRYLGAFGHWIPLPYLPQPGTKQGTYGVGLCVLGRCVCAPNILAIKGRHGAMMDIVKKTLDPKKKEKAQKRQSGQCMRFQGGKSAVLNVMAIPNIAFFVLWQFPKYWGQLCGHASLSMANLAAGRPWILVAAPFSHRSWNEVFRCGVLLASAIDSFDRANVSFPILLLLYLGGCWAAWFGRVVLWRRLVRGDSYAFYEQEWGSAGGLGAALMFLSQALPEERFQFSLYLVPIPVELRAWQTLLANGVLDLTSSTRGSWAGEVAGHLAAWAFGWWMYMEWARQ